MRLKALKEYLKDLKSSSIYALEILMQCTCCATMGHSPKKVATTVVKLNQNIVLRSRKPILPVKNFNQNYETQLI